VRAPKRVEAWVTLGCALVAQGRFDEAEAVLDTADRAHPADGGLGIARARLRSREGRDNEVLAICADILAKQTSVEATMLAGNALRRLGRLDEALTMLRGVHGQAAIACSIAATLLDMDRSAYVIAELTPHVGKPDLPATTRFSIHHLIGEAHEKLGSYESAFEAYVLANQSIKVNFSETGFRSRLALIREVFSAEAIRRAPKASIRSARPVFIASMPRAGTTLLDRIIASHPLGGGAGETRALRGQVAEWNSRNPAEAWPRNVLRFTEADLDRIAQRYLDETTRYGSDALRIADKNVHNWIMVGLIAMALPDARIIHLRRDPMDNGISCFERLEPNSVAWSGDLRNIALAIKGTDSLMAHWKEVSGMPILDVRYEDLVRDPEAQVRRVLDFIGLPWDDACLQHHVAKADSQTGAQTPPPTLGSEQASRPVNDSSIGRATRFGALLDPLRKALGDHL
jgi:tetratricopeptide (TPR) repeat protein